MANHRIRSNSELENIYWNERCQDLRGTKRYNELLRRVRSSLYDEEAAIWYWRIVAHSKLGHIKQSIASLENYQEYAGEDHYAQQFLERELRIHDTENRTSL